MAKALNKFIISESQPILMVNYKEFRHKCVRLNIDPNFN